jgi:glycosyltransferase involved in cell wall biosynthesis
MYLGRHGALGSFVANLAEAARDCPAIEAHFLVSKAGALSETLCAKGLSTYAIATFERPDPASLLLGYVRARAGFTDVLRSVRPHAVVNLMPHVYSPLLGKIVRRHGSAFVPIIHDAAPHPGDPTARITRWLIRDVRSATRVVTLSKSVARTLVLEGYVEPQNVDVLFHPDIVTGTDLSPLDRSRAEAFRVLFFGRIMAYKGLSTFVSAIEALRARGKNIEAGVAGSGKIPDDLGVRLRAIGARVENRWIGDAEVAPLLAQYDAMACPHLEASQSGVAALALGHGLPVVAMPAGGLVEQIQDGFTGVLAQEPDVQGFAAAIERLAGDSELYRKISVNISATRAERSPAHFLSRLTETTATAVRQVHRTTR